MGRLGNTPARRTNFFLDRGRSFAFDMLFEDLREKPFDLTDSVVRIVAESPQHLGGDEVITDMAFPVDLPGGHVQFRLQASDLLLEPAEYPYDVTLLAASGYSTPIIKGLLVIGPSTDDDASNTYPSAASPQSLTVIMHNGATVQVCLEYADGIKGEPGEPGAKGDPTGVFVQADEPPRDAVPQYFPLWVDTDAEDPPEGAFLPLAGGVMDGDIDMDGNALRLVPDPIDPQDPVTLRFLATAGHGADEIWVGPSAPASSYYELWYDTTNSSLKIKVSGSWTPITTGPGGGAEEVWVGPSVPPNNQEVWIDTDEPDPPAGGGGGVVVATGYYRHDQAVPSATWVVNHDLDYHPAVHVQDAAGTVQHATIRHMSSTTLVLSFRSACTGSAHCS